MNHAEFLWIWHAARRAQNKLNRMADFLLLFEGKRSSHQRSDQKTHVLLASWTVRVENLGILKEWRGRRYRGWSRWRRSPRKSWSEGYQKLKSLLSMIKVPTGGRPHSQKQERRNARWVLLNKKRQRASAKSRAWENVTSAVTFANRECPV